ncbi:MAG: sulfatase-like hydrolase/transferase [Actinomycetota bacterium]
MNRHHPPHVLLITLDQFRGDALGSAGHPLVQTPHLDELAAHGVRFARHYTQSTPCAPGRAGLYTGMYQMNHRVVANGTPLDRRFDNVALFANRAGYESVLFGYTDQSIDSRLTTSAADRRLDTYEGLLPGFAWILNLSEDHQPWKDHLAAQGYDVSGGHLELLATEHERPAEVGVSAFTTDRIIEWLDGRDDPSSPWFLHASYLRPHPPYSAPGIFSNLYDPADVGAPIAPHADRHVLHDLLLQFPNTAAPTDPDELAHLRSQYFGLISAVDYEVGRLTAYLRRSGLWESTIVIITADHGEQLGDHGLKEKVGYFEESHHIPLIWRDPRYPNAHGHVVEKFTESVDVLPTIAESVGRPIPRQCDGLPLTDFLQGGEPPRWRTAAHWEFDWRHMLIPHMKEGWPRDTRLATSHLAVLRTEDAAYVQFGDGSWLCFDLAVDATWRTSISDPSRILGLAQEMLTWRSVHTDRTHTDMLMRNGGIGFWPADVPWREEAR